MKNLKDKMLAPKEKTEAISDREDRQFYWFVYPLVAWTLKGLSAWKMRI